ncbi:MAG: hypothetical protein Tp152SUR00d2C52646391_55 [Prokaryotic dsDNA virus sp.]|nr:MAG: hypothetical protein Tp152SUR00d2C52646391_55 [Prokaryotic dsDNA virus sp.]|tara:strand:+ start:165 stop:509 length:345 start_codon:yes stop_codon:yes gene_type:complete
MQVGKYGKYKGQWCLCLAVRPKGLLLIVTESGHKLQIARRNFIVDPASKKNMATIVHYEGISYLITRTKQIYSLKTHRLMNWHETDPIRRAILNLRGFDRVKHICKYAQAKLDI